MKKTQNEIKLIDLWYLDGNYSAPIKTKGFKSIVQSELCYREGEGYVYINPSTRAFTVTNNSVTIFEVEQDAVNHLNKKVKSHIDFVKMQVEGYTEELRKYGAI